MSQEADLVFGASDLSLSMIVDILVDPTRTLEAVIFTHDGRCEASCRRVLFVGACIMGLYGDLIPGVV